MRLRAAVVDDEPLAVRRICSLLAAAPDVEVIGTAHDGLAAVELIAAQRPDVVFLDVQMPEMDGFEVLAALAAGPLPRVVFVTAYDQFAVRAFDVRALDYLLKPYTAERFGEALDRVRTVLGAETNHAIDQRVLALLEEAEARRRLIRHFAVKSEGRVVFVPVAEVECIEADRNYVTLYRRKETFSVRETMANVEKRLDPRVFVRTHRSWIVNLDHVRELRAWFGGGYMAELRSGRTVPLSRQARARIGAILGGSEQSA